MGNGIPALFAFLLLAPVAWAACSGSTQPWLSTEYVASCSGLTPNSTCYAVVSENSTSMGIEVIREYKSPNPGVTTPQVITTDGEGQTAYSFFLDAGRYVEGASYDAVMTCGNSSGALYFAVQGPMPPIALASYGIWLKDSAPYCMAGIILLGAVLIAFAGLRKLSS